MRKSVGIALVVCLAVAAVPIVLIATVSLWSWHKSAQVESSYREYPLLRETRARQRGSTNESAPARQALLEIVPLGTDRAPVIARLREEGFGCKVIADRDTHSDLRRRFMEARGLTDIPNDSRTKKETIDCQTMSSEVLGYKQWIMDLDFDPDGRLSEARVAIWNIFL